ncbi:MAG: hypothetical protein AAGE01_18835 [Pseudomonadota bacterium]
MLVEALPELIATLIGVAVGGTIAFASENIRERRAMNRKAFLVLRSLAREMRENYKVMVDVLPHYESTPYGKSFFLNTSVWETALSSEHLPEVIGFSLADTVAYHYGILERLRYYGDLLIKVWLTTDEVEGYPSIRAGFRKIIIDSLNQAISNHPHVLREIEDHLETLGKSNRSSKPPEIS